MLERLLMHKTNLLFIILLFAAFITLYSNVMVHITSEWTTMYGSYGLVIFVASLYLVWVKRDEIRNLKADPALVTGGFLLAGGGFILFAGQLSASIIIQQVSMVPFLLGAALLYGGVSLFKILLLPVCYLLFLTGIFEKLLGSFAIHLQKFTAWLAVAFYKLIGFPVFHEGTLIVLPHISLEVVRACSGINHVIALLALAVPLAHMTQRNLSRKAILILSAPFIGMFANGLRVFMVGIYAKYNPAADVHGPSETLAVFFVFFFGLMVLVLFSRVLSGKGKRSDPEDQSREMEGQSSTAGSTSEVTSNRKRFNSLIVAGIIFAFTIGLVHFHTPKPVELTQPLDLFPRQIAGYSGKDVPSVAERLRPFPGDRELMRLYKDDQGRSIELYIGYFKIQDQASKLIDYRRAWMHEAPSRIKVQEGDRTFVINRARMQEGATNSHVYFWYQMDQRMIRNEYMGKLLTFMNSLFQRRSNGAVVILRSKDAGHEIMPFLEDAVPKIQALLSNTQHAQP